MDWGKKVSYLSDFFLLDNQNFIVSCVLLFAYAARRLKTES